MKLWSIWLGRASLAAFAHSCGAARAQRGSELDWPPVEPEILRHYQAVLRLDTTNPPGNEHLAVDYLKQVFDAEGIPTRSSRSIPTAPTSSRG